MILSGVSTSLPLSFPLLYGHCLTIVIVVDAAGDVDAGDTDDVFGLAVVMSTGAAGADDTDAVVDLAGVLQRR